ncbi:MAG: hypothetical protein WBW34_04425, partial [Nitrososphaeraceae archaeon]
MPAKRNNALSRRYRKSHVITAALFFLSLVFGTTGTGLINTHLQQQQQVHAQEEKRKAIIGAWAPYQRPLEKIQDVGQQQEAMKALLAKGFVEYYFVMTDFKNSYAKEMTEKLLTSADEIGLHMLIILLPPSEGGPNTNYDWEGWLHYFNSLKSEHESFKGFTIDEFNWI